MSVGISQIEYWRPTNKSENASNASTVPNTNEGGQGAAYLSYDVFMGLSILGGFFALDHLYLRSPLTFLAKIIVNIITLGSWWMYDASQAIFNKDVVKVFGLGIPGLGPKGLAAGVLASDIPDKKHMSFLIYGLCLLLGGIFGLDSFIVGDKSSGFIRLICLISVILAPVAILWWLFNVGKFLINPKSVVNLYWDFFGAPPPAEYTMTLGEKIVSKIPFLQTIFGPVIGASKTVLQTTDIATNPSSIITAPIEIAGKTIGKVVQSTISELKPVIQEVIEPAAAVLEPALEAVQPLKQTLNSGIQVVQSGIDTVQDGLLLGKTAIETGSTIANKTLNTIGQTADAATKALTLAPGAAQLSNSLSTMAAQQALNRIKQEGGGNSNVLPFMLIGTLGLIAVSGLVLTIRRFKKNDRPRKDDSPPEPGVL